MYDAGFSILDNDGKESRFVIQQPAWLRGVEALNR